MSAILPGRYAAKPDGEFVVSPIGMRINNLLAVREWLPVATAMGPMLQYLATHPEKGYVGGRTLLEWPGVEKFARDPSDPHFPAWAAFHKNAGSDGSVGIWHKTYVVRAGGAEAMYVNVPRTGLAAATRQVRAGGSLSTARKRLAQSGASRETVEPLRSPRLS
jgi:hypothetical protein